MSRRRPEPAQDAVLAPGATGQAATVAEVRDRSVRGVAAVALRGIGVRAVGLLVSVVLARLLLPADFGLLAFGTTLLVVGTFLTDAGLAAQLVRGASVPTRRQLSAVLGLQLALTVVIVAVATVVLLRGGRQEHVTALMLWALVPATFRVPATVQLERVLQFRAVAVSEVLETVVYAVLAVGLVALGAGVWGVAVATVVRPCVGATVLQRAAPTRVLRPTLDRAAVAPLLAFGLTFQLANLVVLVRDQGINLVTLGLGGSAVLGYWSLAQRIMLVPFLLFESLWRVSYPAVARLLEAGHDVREDLGRALVLGSFLTGLVVVPLAVGAPAFVPAVFGTAWTPMVPVVPLAAAGLVVSGPLSAVGAGFLTATGRLWLVVAAQVSTLVAWALLLPVLLPRIGVTANGVAWAAACLADAAVLAWALRRHGHVAVLASTGPTVLAALLVGGGGVAIVARRDLALLPGLGVVAGCTLIYLGLSLLVARSAYGDLRRLLAVVRPLRSTPPPA